MEVEDEEYNKIYIYARSTTTKKKISKGSECFLWLRLMEISAIN